MAAEEAPEEARIYPHEQLCRDVLATCLENVKEAELHFFWTTGRTLSDNEAWGAIRDVPIGGERYRSMFDPSLEILLKNSPSHLKVKLVCDTPTIESNRPSLDYFYRQYGDRFETLPIEGVQDRLLKVFPEHQEQVNKVFRNATAGNPAIASDIYRLIAMPYSHDLSPEAMTETQYAYCDVDTFSEAMKNIYDGSWGHADILWALFRKPVNSGNVFYLGRAANNNDLIKLSIKNIDEYKRFCVSVLERVVKTPHAGLLTMFSNLHQAIKECEKPESVEVSYKELRSRSIINVMNATGPGFLLTDWGYLLRPGVVYCAENYPSVSTTLAWHGGTQLLAKERGNSLFSGIPLPLSGGTLNDEAYTAQEDAFERYTDILATALYAKPFGYNHPFNVKIREHLKENFPYFQAFHKNIDELLADNPTGRFKDFIKEAYDYEKTNGWIEGTDDEWLEQIFKVITTCPGEGNETALNNYAPYYVRLTHLLKQVGVEVPFTVKDIDFRISTSEAHP